MLETRPAKQSGVEHYCCHYTQVLWDDFIVFLLLLFLIYLGYLCLILTFHLKHVKVTNMQKTYKLNRGKHTCRYKEFPVCVSDAESVPYRNSAVCPLCAAVLTGSSMMDNSHLLSTAVSAGSSLPAQLTQSAGATHQTTAHFLSGYSLCGRLLAQPAVCPQVLSLPNPVRFLSQDRHSSSSRPLPS